MAMDYEASYSAEEAGVEQRDPLKNPLPHVHRSPLKARLIAPDQVKLSSHRVRLRPHRLERAGSRSVEREAGEAWQLEGLSAWDE
jgi:hypothetical protein